MIYQIFSTFKFEVKRPNTDKDPLIKLGQARASEVQRIWTLNDHNQAATALESHVPELRDGSEGDCRAGGIWIAAEFKKRTREGYILDMPMIATEINGSDWNLYMIYATEEAGSDTV